MNPLRQGRWLYFLVGISPGLLNALGREGEAKPSSRRPFSEKD